MKQASRGSGLCGTRRIKWRPRLFEGREGPVSKVDGLVGNREHKTQATSQRASKDRRCLDLMEQSCSSQRLT